MKKIILFITMYTFSCLFLFGDDKEGIVLLKSRNQEYSSVNY